MGDIAGGSLVLDAVDDSMLAFYRDVEELLAARDSRDLPVVDVVGRLGPPIAWPHQIYGFGLNDADHAAETGQRRHNDRVDLARSTRVEPRGLS